MARYLIPDLQSLVAAALEKAGASKAMASATARALVLAEAQGLSSHGLLRVAQYTAHLKHNRADGSAICKLVRDHNAVAVVDAGTGLAFPACELAISEAMRRARTFGVSLVGVINSHHAGVMVDNLRPVADEGMVGLAFSNVPAVMPVAGGKRAMVGTNPIAAIFPRLNASPIMIDMSLSEVSRGKVAIAAQRGEQIPLGWALDSNGNPTTDPQAALDGSMLALGSVSSVKGSLLALLVELLTTVVIGAEFGFKASSFFKDEGNVPKLGQTFIAIDLTALTGTDRYFGQFEGFIEELLRDEQMRIPGERREVAYQLSLKDGIEVSDGLLAQLGLA